MTREADVDITGLLHRWSQGDRTAEAALFEAVLPNLQNLAVYFMKRERPDHSLQATELVHQIYLKLVAAKNRDWRNRGHFFAIAARAMRRYLIDHARGRPDAKFVALEGLENSLRGENPKTELALAIDELLEELSKVEPEWVHIVEVKYFLGLTDEDAADALGIARRTLQRKWSDARQWLRDRMEQRGGPPHTPER